MAGKLYYCFADFKKAFDFVPQHLLWKVLEEQLGIHGRILDIMKFLYVYAHDSAAVCSPEGVPAIFRCVLGVKQGCPSGATPYGLCVDGLDEAHSWH